MARWRFVFCGLIVMLVVGVLLYSFMHFPPMQPSSQSHSLGVTPTITTRLASSPTIQATRAIQPAGQVQIDTRIPIQTVVADPAFHAINAAFGSRFDFTPVPGSYEALSGTDGVFHENAASYIVGIAPA